MSRILLVEDEEHLRDAIRLNLEMEGHEVIAAGDALSLDPIFNHYSIDLVLLDVMLPVMDGFDACQQIRSRDPLIPIIFLTARNTGEDRIKGLRLGADDYLSKPFHIEELLLRVNKLLKRSAGKAEETEVFEFDGHKVDFKRFMCYPKGKPPVGLNRREADLLRLLISRRGMVVSRDEILESLWNEESYPSPRVIDNYILHFRKIFSFRSLKKRYFHSVRGVGYKFMP